MNSPHAVTLKKIAQGINPDWELKDWIQWPPDMFALCATIINRTGSYKLLLMDPLWWNDSSWEKNIQKLGVLWIKYANSMLLKRQPGKTLLENKVFEEYFQILQADWDSDNCVNLDHLRVLGKIFKKGASEQWKGVGELARALLFMYVLADSSCEGLGFLGQPLAKQNLSHRNFMCVANLLLTNTGSLSTIPKFHGVVLPKMRTPQAGMSARSVTHYLTFHTTEVEVFWRTFPWLERRNKSLNILAVPYPNKVEANDFKLMDDNYQAVRYFKANINARAPDEDFFRRLVEKTLELTSEQKQVDIIVLPEMALSELQYNFLLKELHLQFADAKCLAKLPIIVAGVMSEYPDETSNSSINETFLNEVRLALHFAGKWHSTTQRKHHRWQLDRSQIQQYELEGHFTADNLWFEYCTVSQRRLTILAPNDWLALTALICEDLARQEPVGEVIRGIGPTLLMALLSDGPQLKERWSARYASVLADDPGTAVLSLTSRGMMERSKSADPKVNESRKPVIGLWKDMIRSWREFSLSKENDGLLFTISSKYHKEFTLDGRSDRQFASVFQIDSQEPLAINFAKASKSLAASTIAPSPVIESSNLRELSAIQFAIDAIIDILVFEKLEDIKKETGNVSLTKDLVLNLLQGKDLDEPNDKKIRSRISQIVSRAWKEPHSIGISASAATESGKEMETTTKIIDKCMQEMTSSGFTDVEQLYSKMIELCRTEMSKTSLHFEDKQVYTSILYNLFNRIVNWHPSHQTIYQISGLTVSRAMDLKSHILKIIYDESTNI